MKVENQSKNWLQISLLICFGLVVLAISVFVSIQIRNNRAFNQQLLVVQPTIYPTQAIINPTVLTTENLTLDATTNWKTYSRIANFTFLFPNDWTEQPNYSLQSNNKLMTIWIRGETVGLECLTLVKTESKVFNSTNLVLKYYDGIKSDNCDTRGNKAIFFLFTVENKRYSFTFDYKDPYKEKSEELFNQILSTFKFTS